jgi:DnaJ family protein A protein 2
MFGNPIGRRKGKDAKQDLHITLEDLYNGMSRSFKLNKNVICDHCKGSGSKTGKL